MNGMGLTLRKLKFPKTRGEYNITMNPRAVTVIMTFIHTELTMPREAMGRIKIYLVGSDENEWEIKQPGVLPGPHAQALLL
jgi:hypothetical protein